MRSAADVHERFVEESQCPIVKSVAKELGEAIDGAHAKLHALFHGGSDSGSLQDTIDHDCASPSLQDRALPGSPGAGGASVLQSDEGSAILIHTLEATRQVAQRFAVKVQGAARLGFVEDRLVRAVDKLVEGIISEVDAFDPSFSAFGRSMRASLLPSLRARSSASSSSSLRSGPAVASNAISLRHQDSERSAL